MKKNPILILVAISLIPLGVFNLYAEMNAESIVGLIILILVDVPLIMALFNSYHEVTDLDFIIVFGPIKKIIPLWEIRTVEYSYNPLSSPSWTFKRIKIVTTHYRTFLMSSPQNETEFKELLKKKCPNAKVLI